jgi:hypothetical protein|tara:strand:+ start:247 stop:399 length:153 start_codon:yes stop_codon:yes gene_type:complete
VVVVVVKQLKDVDNQEDLVVEEWNIIQLLQLEEHVVLVMELLDKEIQVVV